MRNYWKISIVVILLVLSLSAGCAKPAAESKGLQLVKMVSSIGSVDPERFDEQRISYTINLCNDSSQSNYISFVEPVVTDGINSRITSPDIRREVKKKIEAGKCLEVKGEFIFDAGDLSKQDIIAMEPIITGFRLGTEEIIHAIAEEMD